VLRERANGPGHASLVELLVGLAEANAALGERDAAIVGMDRAIAIASAKDSAADLLARTRFAKAKLMWEDPDARATAIALAEQARDGFERSSTEHAEVEAWLQSHTLGE
jgi:ATP/maltotriose-dependent transcriptional regulator MalT